VLRSCSKVTTTRFTTSSANAKSSLPPAIATQSFESSTSCSNISVTSINFSSTLSRSRAIRPFTHCQTGEKIDASHYTGVPVFVLVPLPAPPYVFHYRYFKNWPWYRYCGYRVSSCFFHASLMTKFLWHYLNVHITIFSLCIISVANGVPLFHIPMNSSVSKPELSHEDFALLHPLFTSFWKPIRSATDWSFLCLQENISFYF